MSPTQQMGVVPIGLAGQQKNVAHNHIIYMYLELILFYRPQPAGETHEHDSLLVGSYM